MSDGGEKAGQMSLSALCSNDNNDVRQSNTKGISLEDYYKIFSVLTHIDDVDKVSFESINVITSLFLGIKQIRGFLGRNCCFLLI